MSIHCAKIANQCQSSTKWITAFNHSRSSSTPTVFSYFLLFAPIHLSASFEMGYPLQSRLAFNVFFFIHQIQATVRSLQLFTFLGKSTSDWSDFVFDPHLQKNSSDIEYVDHNLIGILMKYLSQNMGNCYY